MRMSALSSIAGWIGAVSTGFVLTLALSSLGRTSPGELASVHLAVERTADENGCAACHEVHGSPNRHLLRHQTQVNLCYECHSASVTPAQATCRYVEALIQGRTCCI